MSASWHADDSLLARYACGAAGPLEGASLEQHLTHCAPCRARIAGHVQASALELVWERIREQAQEPVPGLVERLLTRLGASGPDALLVAAAPSLRTSWLFGLAMTLGFVCLSAAYGGDRGLAFFLLIAPLVPVAGVACAYGPDVDPAHELEVVAPYSGVRLLLLRTGAVLVTCLPLVLAAALLVPALAGSSVLWLLPALALTAGTLAASTWVRPAVAGGVLAAGWLCAVASAAWQRDPAAVLDPAALRGYAALGVGAVLVLGLRLRHLTLPGSLL